MKNYVLESQRLKPNSPGALQCVLAFDPYR